MSMRTAKSRENSEGLVASLVRPVGYVFATLALLVFSLSSSLQAGTVQHALAAKIASGASSFVTVWIKVRDTETAGNRSSRLSTTASEQKLSRAQQYERAYQDITESCKQSQASLRNTLDTLELRGRASRITPRWIVNVIEASVASDEIDQLAARSDVEQILLPPVIELITPEVGNDPRTDANRSASVEPGADYVRVRQAWALGYTGKGRLVCSFDSGVQGTHNYLKDRWRGSGGSTADSAAAWLDQVNKTRSPSYFGSGIPRMHGTHTMGIMVGRNGTDTIGIAPDAQWISAAVIDITGGASILQAFEWAANPDGNLNTMSDVPDVINHSWGISETGCDFIFDDAIDNTEALGIVNIFAAGNEGSVVGAIRNPATRARDSIDCFAVGNLSLGSVPPSINSSSSHGPSECNGAIKPNVSAPGTNIRSSVPDNTTGFLTGTSMSAPCVSGLVALMRQKNPNATVREIKLAILNTTKRSGYTTGGTIPNNAVGWGVIDCEAALNALASPQASAALRVYSFPTSAVQTGATVTGKVVLKNLGGIAVNNLTGIVTSSSSDATVTDGTLAFGTIPNGDTARSSDGISVEVSSSVIGGTVIPLTLTLTGTGYSGSLPLYLQVVPTGSRQIAEIGSGRSRLTFTNYGVFGLGPSSMMPLDSLGYRFGNGGNELFEAGLIVSRSLTQVSSGVHSSLYEWLDDFTPAPGGTISFLSPARFGGKEAHARFSDTNATQPLGIVISQELIAPPSPNDDILLLRYIIDNPTAVNLTGTPFSLFTDWDANAQYNKNAGGYSSSDTLLWTAYNSGSSLSNYRGVTLIGDTPSSALTASASALVYPAFSGVGSDGFSSAEKYISSQSGFTTSSVYANGSLDICQMFSTNLQLPALVGRDTILFAIVAGSTFQDITAAAARARTLIFSCCSNTTGDVNCDGHYAELDDLTLLVDNLFISFAPLCCTASADLDGSGAVDITDLTVLVDAMFINFPPLPACQ